MKNSVAFKILKDLVTSSYYTSIALPGDIIGKGSADNKLDEELKVTLSTIPNQHEDGALLYLIEASYRKRDESYFNYSRTYGANELSKLNGDIVKVFYPETIEKGEKRFKSGEFKRLVRILNSSL